MSERLPVGWIVDKLSSLASLEYGKSPNLVKDEQGQYPIIGTSGVVGRAKKFICDETSVVIGRKGTINNPIYVDKPFWAIDTTFYCKLSENTDPKWFFYKICDEALEKHNEASGVPSLSRETLKSIHFKVPPVAEQKKIAAILTSVDEVIANTQKQIDKLQDLKKATMNELLTKGIGHTQFKDSEMGTIPKSWGVSIVKNCVVEMTSGWSPDCLPEPVVGSQWGILKTTSVTWNGFDINENKALPAHLDGRTQISLRVGDVLVTRAGPIDRVGVVAFCNETYPKIMLSDKIIRIRSKSDELTGEFLAIWLGSSVAQQNMRSKISGMAEAQSNISQDILKSIPVPLPSLTEQGKIVQILQSLDVRIIRQKNKLAQTQALKKSLMQDLLTGKVRVQVN